MYVPFCSGIDICVLLSPVQDRVFQIDPNKVEDGKGKSPYDPKHQAASVLIGEYKDRTVYIHTPVKQCQPQI